MTMVDDRPVPTCPQCGGPAHRPKRMVITTPEDDLYNDAIDRECEQRLLDRMRRG